MIVVRLGEKIQWRLVTSSFTYQGRLDTGSLHRNKRIMSFYAYFLHLQVAQSSIPNLLLFVHLVM